MREAPRGCGFRKPGGLYLVCDGPGMTRDRLPVPVAACACCGFAPVQTRSFSWVPGRWLGDHRILGFGASRVPSLERTNALERCADAEESRIVGGHDPVCVADDSPRLLMRVGARYYSPGAFTEEASRLGVSKRIAELPTGIKFGETWVLLAHPEACHEPVSWSFRWLFGDGEVGTAPGVFHAFVPVRAELILRESEATPERIAKEAARGVSIVIVPDGAADARVSWRPGEERPAQAPPKLETFTTEDPEAPPFACPRCGDTRPHSPAECESLRAEGDA